STTFLHSALSVFLPMSPDFLPNPPTSRTETATSFSGPIAAAQLRSLMMRGALQLRFPRSCPTLIPLQSPCCPIPLLFVGQLRPPILQPTMCRSSSPPTHADL